MTTFFSNVPIWVFPLFVLLLALGFRASKDRKVPVLVISAMPLLGILTVRNILSLSPPSWIWLIAAFAYFCGVLFGMKVQHSLIGERTKRFAVVKGEWMTLTAMMLIFCAGFANGFLAAIAPFVTSSSIFLVLFVVTTCAPAGHFLGRAITTVRTKISPAT